MALLNQRFDLKVCTDSVQAVLRSDYVSTFSNSCAFVSSELEVNFIDSAVEKALKLHNLELRSRITVDGIIREVGSGSMLA